LGKGARRHHQTAEGNFTRKVQWGRDQNWGYDRNPAEACGHPGKIGESGDQAARGGEDVDKMHLNTAPLVRLARGEGNTIQMFVDAYQRKTQIRLARIAFGVAAHETSADPVTEQRAE